MEQIVTPAAERYFDLAWPPWQPPPGDGLAAFVATNADTRWADGLLARDDDGRVVWAAAGSSPERHGLAILNLPGVRAVTLTPAGGDPRRVGLAMQVAAHLAARRAGVRAVDACLTSYSQPTPPSEVVRIPHLVAIRQAGGVTDTVVWELTPAEAARQWLGGPLPDQHFFETHLSGLLRLRAAARTGQLPATPTAAKLDKLLHERCLSIKLVYQRADLFRTLLAPADASGRA